MLPESVNNPFDFFMTAVEAHQPLISSRPTEICSTKKVCNESVSFLRGALPTAMCYPNPREKLLPLASDLTVVR